MDHEERRGHLGPTRRRMERYLLTLLLLSVAWN